MTADYMRPWFGSLGYQHNLIFHDQTSPSIQGCLSEIDALITAPEKTVLIGHSWGWFLVRRYCHDYINQIRGTTALGPMYLTDERSKDGMAFLLDKMSDEDRAFRKEKWPEDIAGQEQRAAEFMRRINPYYHHDFNFRLSGTLTYDRSIAAPLNTEAKGYDHRSLVTSLPNDTCLIYGASDYIKPEAEYKGIEQHIIPDAGHYMFAEKNAETLAVMTDFLNRLAD